jgi:hypothetical protein
MRRKGEFLMNKTMSRGLSAVLVTASSLLICVTLIGMTGCGGGSGPSGGNRISASELIRSYTSLTDEQWNGRFEGKTWRVSGEVGGIHPGFDQYSPDVSLKTGTNGTVLCQFANSSLEDKARASELTIGQQVEIEGTVYKFEAVNGVLVGLCSFPSAP